MFWFVVVEPLLVVGEILKFEEVAAKDNLVLSTHAGGVCNYGFFGLDGSAAFVAIRIRLVFFAEDLDAAAPDPVEERDGPPLGRLFEDLYACEKYLSLAEQDGTRQDRRLTLNHVSSWVVRHVQLGEESILEYTWLDSLTVQVRSGSFVY